MFETRGDEYRDNGKAELFDRLKDFVNADEDAGTPADAARELGTTASAVKVAVHRVLSGA